MRTCEHNRLSVDTVLDLYSCLECGTEFSWDEVKRMLAGRRTGPLLYLVSDPPEEDA